jgi:hypothetical protein
MMPAMSSVTRTMTRGQAQRHDVAQHDAPGEAPISLHGGDVVGLADRQRLGAGDAGIGRPGGDGDRDHRVLDARPERGDEGQRQDQARKGQEDVGDAHQHGVEPAARITRHRAHQQPDRRGQHRHQHHHVQRDARAVDHAR